MAELGSPANRFFSRPEEPIRREKSEKLKTRGERVRSPNRDSRYSFLKGFLARDDSDKE